MEEYSQNKLKNQNGKKNPINKKKTKNKNQCGIFRKRKTKYGKNEFRNEKKRRI